MAIANQTPSVSIIIPVHNEAGNIGKVIEDIKEVNVRSWEIIVVDDCSVDGTKEEVDTEYVRLLTHDENGGKGKALRTGIAAAQGEFVVFMDGDGQDDAKDIPLLLKEIESETNIDMVMGSRFKGRIIDNFMSHIRDGSVQVINYVGNISLTIIINLFFNLKLTDSQAGFKCFRRDKVRGLSLESNGFEIETEILVHASKENWNIGEVAVTRRSRQSGTSDLYGIPFGRIIFGFRVMKTILGRWMENIWK